MVWKQWFVVVVMVLVCTSHVLVSAQNTGAQGLGISPAVLEVEAEPGKAYDLEYLVENNTGIDNISVDVSIETFEEGSIQGSANVVPFKPERDLSYWLTVPKLQVYKQLEKKKQTYQLTIPQDTTPGAYFFAIVYQPQTSVQQKIAGGNTVELKNRIATLLFVNIGGDSSKQPQIENYTTSSTWIDPVFDRLDILYDVRVKGNSFYRPIGNIFLNDTGSETITTLSSFTSDRLILPNAVRGYKYCVKSNVYIGKTCESIELDGKLPWLGSRTLTLRLDYNDGNGNPQTVVADKAVYIFPYKITLLVISGVLLWLALYRVILVVRRNYARKQE